MSRSVGDAPTSPSLKAKLFLVFFGISLALAIIEGGLWILNQGKQASSFDSIDDLRSVMGSAGHDADATGRGVSLKSIITPHADNNIIYDLRPHLDVQFQRARVVTNSCGMRSPERSIAKPARTFRIALLGDSFAFGWGVEYSESFAQRLEDNLNHMYRGSPSVEVLNFGVPGYSTFQEVYQFLDKGVSFNPDAILVFFVQNDFGPPFFLRSIGSKSLVPSSQIAELSMRALDPNAPEKALLNAGLDPNRSLMHLAEYGKQAGIPVFVAINPRKDWQDQYNKLWVLAKRKDLIFMKLRKPFLESITRRHIPSSQLTLSFDPHPSPLRHAIYGDIMTPYFMDTIAQSSHENS